MIAFFSFKTYVVFKRSMRQVGVHHPSFGGVYLGQAHDIEESHNSEHDIELRTQPPTSSKDQTSIMHDENNTDPLDAAASNYDQLLERSYFILAALSTQHVNNTDEQPTPLQPNESLPKQPQSNTPSHFCVQTQSSNQSIQTPGSTKQSRRRKSVRPDVEDARRACKMKHDRTNVKSLLLLVTVMYVCWLPYIVFNAIIIISPNISYNTSVAMSALEFFAIWLAASNCFWNTIVYAASSKAYRRGLKKVYNKYLCCKKRLVNDEMARSQSLSRMLSVWSVSRASQLLHLQQEIQQTNTQ